MKTLKTTLIVTASIIGAVFLLMAGLVIFSPDPKVEAAQKKLDRQKCVVEFLQREKTNQLILARELGKLDEYEEIMTRVSKDTTLTCAQMDSLWNAFSAGLK